MSYQGGDVDDEREYYSLVKRVFDILAPFYDVVTAPLFLTVRDKVVRFTNAEAGSVILDVATGTGKQAFAFGKRGYVVAGVDISEAMLRVANSNNKYKDVTFRVADATKLPLEDASFDVSCVSFALHDMPLTVRTKTLREMVRVTRPGGMIVIVDYALPRNRVSQFLIYNLVKLWEAKYYEQFIHSDLDGLVRGEGIEIVDLLRLSCGAGRVLKGLRSSTFLE